MISDEFYKANLAYQIRDPFVDYYYDTLCIKDLEQIIDEPDRTDEIISLAVILPRKLVRFRTHPHLDTRRIRWGLQC